MGELLRAIDGYEGLGIAKLALQIALRVFMRPGELRHAEWCEFDFDNALWTIPAEKTKMPKPQHAPLSQADIFAAFDMVSKAWRGLKIGEALVLEWPTLGRIGHPIG